MRGHESLVSLRRRGLRPTGFVFFSTEPCDRSLGLENWLDDGDLPHVWLDPSDRPDRLDLRWCVGLTVFVYGDDRARIASLSAALLNAGARRVVATCGKDVVSDLTREVASCA